MLLESFKRTKGFAEIIACRACNDLGIRLESGTSFVLVLSSFEMSFEQSNGDSLVFGKNRDGLRKA